MEDNAREDRARCSQSVEEISDKRGESFTDYRNVGNLEIFIDGIIIPILVYIKNLHKPVASLTKLEFSCRLGGKKINEMA